jgi:poly-gamma-glutamate synthesis protein (capsule biosynthesis protein)
LLLLANAATLTLYLTHRQADRKQPAAAARHSLSYFTKGPAAQRSVASMLFTGDIMLDRNVKTRVDSNGLGYVLDTLAGQEGRFFGGYDLVSANLEGAVTNGGAHYAPEAGIDFAFNPSTVDQLHRYGFNFFNTANNHSLDQGRQGVAETYANLTSLGFIHSGCPDSEVGSCTATTTRIGNMNIGLAGFSMVYHPLDLDAAAQKVAELASSTDFVAVNIHWGTEYEHQFSPSQQAVAHRLIDAGADLIIGSHPHVVQGIERYNGKLIFYSLGNFIFDQYFSPDTQAELAVGIAASWEQASAEPSYAAYLFPIQSKQSQLALMASSSRQLFLSQLASWSNLGSADSAGVLAGVVGR